MREAASPNLRNGKERKQEQKRITSVLNGK
jgi:hypothetical protein